MSSKTNSEFNGCTFQWNIENYPYWLKKGERIVSPSFSVNCLENIKWSLRLYPIAKKNENFMSLYLGIEKNHSESDRIEVDYQLAFLDGDGKFLIKRTAFGDVINREGCRGYKEFEAREKVFGTERPSFLHKDTLRIHCTICKKGEKCEEAKHSSALTVFKVNRLSFVWRIEKFSFIKPDFINKVKGDLIEFHLVLKEGPEFQKKIVIDVISHDESIKFFSIKTSILNSVEGMEDCGIYEYFADDLKKGILSAPLFTKKLMENKNLYLPNDVLTLACEHASSDGTFQYEIFSDGIIYSNITITAVRKSSVHDVEKEKLPNMPVLVDDLKSMFTDKTLWDTELRTPTQTFQAHKSLLSARSPVFMSMFRNDMKEKISGHVDITDLEDDTLQRMLEYIYTDSMGDMQLEIACKLYSAADKYEILSLKMRCSNFLKKNLCANKVCDVLVLADLHQDDDLKTAVQDYMLEQDKEVFCSQEWKNFMVANSQLATAVMYRKIFSS